MGREKLILEVGGEPIVRRVCDALAAACQEVLVAGRSELIPLERVRWVTDERRGQQGPLAGLEAGLRAARNPLIFVAAGDMPFLSPGLVRYLIGRLFMGDACAVVPRYSRVTHPLCAAYDRRALAHVEAALDAGVRAVRGLLERLPGVEYVDDEDLERLGDPGVFLLNVNSPEDLERARSCWVGGWGTSS